MAADREIQYVDAVSQFGFIQQQGRIWKERGLDKCWKRICYFTDF